MTESGQSSLSLGGTPRSLGRYEIIGALARGGMATVYLGRHTGEAGFQRLYAIKVMHPHLSDDESFVGMLLDEARIAARLHHPNVVPIVDLGSQDGLHYLAMEYVEGCSLSALLTRYRDSRPPRIIVPLILDALAGLQSAHTLTDDDGNAMRLVHRDVSPQNVLVGVDGNARITDFGIAKAESRVNSTRPGQLKGKLAFMSPEQMKDASSTDCRSDIFSAGVMLWSALTGRKLFLGANDGETLHNILMMPIPPPSTVGQMPPAVLDPIILRALERDPEKRYATALEMEEALRDVALRNGLLAPRREITDWIIAGFGHELNERRNAIRAAVSQASFRRDGGMNLAQSGVSGLRMIPQIGSLTPPDGGDSAARRAQEALLVDRGSLTWPMDAATSRRRTMMVGATIAAGVALLVLGVAVALRFVSSAPAGRAPAASSASASVQEASAASAQAAVAPATTPAAAADAAPSKSDKPEKSDKPDAAPTARPPAVWRPPPPPPKSKSTPAPPPPAVATPPPEPKKKPAWDNDSPLPPPQ